MISVSIIIPVYHVECYIQRCLESVFEQDQSEAEIECLVIDDCGHDKSMAIVRHCLENYHGAIRFKIIEHTENKGLSAARNTGVCHSRGEYILFMDSDDYLMPGSIQYFVDNLKLYPDVDMIVGNALDCRNNSALFCCLEQPTLLTSPDDFYVQMLQHKIYLYAWNKMIRKNLIKERGICFLDRILYEDQLWSYQLFAHLSSILLLPQITYEYTNNPSSIVNTTFNSGMAEHVLWSYTVSINKMLDTPPPAGKMQRNVSVDYLLFMAHLVMTGVDILSQCVVPRCAARDFRKVRLRLLKRSVSYGRILLSCFLLLLFSPFYYLLRLRFFRRYYFKIEMATNYLSHLTDFLHHKHRL